MRTRREFFRSCVLGTAGLILNPQRYRNRTESLSSYSLGPRPAKSNPYVTKEGKPLLICIEGYDVRTMLSKGLQALGGLNKLIKKKDKVLIKPNLVLRETVPGASQFPTMSSPDTIRELIYLVKEITTRIRVGDQGGEDQSLIYDKLDLINTVVGAGAKLLNFEKDPLGTLNVRSLEWKRGVPSFKVFTSVYNSSVIFNLCNLKRHSSAFMTCAIKNNFGTLQGRWNFGTRGYLHRHPNLSEEFVAELPEMAALIRPELTIVDARAIMIGDGPILSYPKAKVKKGINLMVLSGDMVAVDAYCSQRILKKHDPSFKPKSIRPTLEGAEKLGLGTADLSQVEILKIDETWMPSNL